MFTVKFWQPQLWVFYRKYFYSVAIEWTNDTVVVKCYYLYWARQHAIKNRY